MAMVMEVVRCIAQSVCRRRRHTVELPESPCSRIMLELVSPLAKVASMLFVPSCVTTRLQSASALHGGAQLAYISVLVVGTAVRYRERAATGRRPRKKVAETGNSVR